MEYLIVFSVAAMMIANFHVWQYIELQRPAYRMEQTVQYDAATGLLSVFTHGQHSRSQSYNARAKRWCPVLGYIQW